MTDSNSKIENEIESNEKDNPKTIELVGNLYLDAVEPDNSKISYYWNMLLIGHWILEIIRVQRLDK